MDKYISSVKEFHETFNHPINDYKNDIPLKTRQLRINLLFEELKELAHASDVLGTFRELCLETISMFSKKINLLDGNNVDKKEEIDSLCDLQYVLSGAVLSLGHHENFEEAFDEVQRSNMSKMCHSEQEVQDTINHYKEKDGTEAYFVKKGDGWIILRKDDDKILKNVYYKAAQLEKFVKL